MKDEFDKSHESQSAVSHRRFLTGAVIYFLLILAVVILLDRILWADIIDDILEGLMCVGVAFFVVSRRIFRHFFISMPRFQQAIFVIFFSFMMIGQLVDLPRRTFPFIGWTMYGRAEKSHEIKAYSYRGITRQGKMIDVNPVVLFPTLAHGRMALALEKRIEGLLNIENTDQEDQGAQRPEGMRGVVFDFRMGMLPKPEKDFHRKEKEFAEFLIAIGRTYNRKFPDRSLEAIEVVQTKKDIADFFKTPQVRTVFHAALERER